VSKRERKAQRLNRNLVTLLKRRKCIVSPTVETAFRAVPRHHFLPNVPLPQAYANQAIPTKVIGNRAVSSASQPAMIAIMLEQLALEPGHNVLEIGAGTGYNAALMAHIVGPHGRVTTVDIDADLVAQARANLALADVPNVVAICADGGYGYAAAAPYARIILTVGVSDISPYWLEQLTENGRLVLPLEVGGGQKSIAFEQVDGRLHSRSIRECAFITLRGAYAGAQAGVSSVSPEPGLEVIAMQSDAQPPDFDQIYTWLQQPRSDWDTGLLLTPYELFGGLLFWLAVHGQALHTVRATGEMAERNHIPALIQIPDEKLYVSTRVVCAAHGMVALIRLPAPGTDDDLDAAEFGLGVRQFGAAANLAQCLMQHVRAWDAAGRPTLSDWRIRLDPPGVTPPVQPGELVLEKPRSRLVLRWQRPNRSTQRNR